MGNNVLEIGGLNDPPELTEAMWAVRKNALKITALENKLKTLDPALASWEESAQELYLAQEAQKQFVYAAFRIRYEYQSKT